MSATQPQACPLCETAAVFYPVDYGHRKYFDCPSCGRFQISTRAEAKLSAASAAWRASCAAKAARAPEGELLVITVPSVQQVPGIGYESLTADFVPKDKLPL